MDQLQQPVVEENKVQQSNEKQRDKLPPTNQQEGKKEKKSGKDKILIKSAKGTRDFLPL